jgi:hypothetical protein
MDVTPVAQANVGYLCGSGSADKPEQALMTEKSSSV